MTTKKERIKRLVKQLFWKILVFSVILGATSYLINFPTFTNEMAKAQAEAEAMNMLAEAEAKANELLSQSMTPALLEKMYYEKWNGELPYIYGDSTPIIQVP